MIEIVTVPTVEWSAEKIKQTPLFQDWERRLGPDWSGSATITSADIWGMPEKLHMLQMTVKRDDAPWAELITLRPETVDVLATVTDGEKYFVVFVKQWRNASGCMVISNPAGGVEEGETPKDAAHRELVEELGLNTLTDISCSIRIWYVTPNPGLASPGTLNERNHMMAAEIMVPEDKFEQFLSELQGKKTGVEAEGEDIKLIFVPFGKALGFIGSQRNWDNKALLSLMLYMQYGKRQ